MEDNYLKDVEEDKSNTTLSPPRKKTKTNHLRHKISAHEGQCSSILFLNSPSDLVSAGKGNAVKIWDTSTGMLSRSLDGFQGSVCDMAISSDNNLFVSGLTTQKLGLWDLNTGQASSISTTHQQKISAVDISKVTARYIASAANDHRIVLQDLQCESSTTSFCSSNCNALCFVKDDSVLCSGYVNGKIEFRNVNWMGIDKEIDVHTQQVTSICQLQNGNAVLTSGRDNWHNLIDARTMQVCKKFKTKSNKIVTSRSCVSPDEDLVAVGSADGSVHIWSIQMGRKVDTLKEHDAPVVSCAWTATGSCLASADSDGIICIWS